MVSLINFFFLDFSNIEEENAGIEGQRLEAGLKDSRDILTPGTEAYFANNLSPVPEPQPELASNKLFRMKVSQQELRNLCSQESLNVTLGMNSHGNLFMVEDSFLKRIKRYNEVIFYFIIFLLLSNC